MNSNLKVCKQNQSKRKKTKSNQAKGMNCSRVCMIFAKVMNNCATKHQMCKRQRKKTDIYDKNEKSASQTLHQQLTTRSW